MMKTDILSSVEVIGNSAFYGCSGLTEVVLPETLSSMGESCRELHHVKKGGAGRNASGNQPVLFLWLSYTDGCRIPGFHDKEWNTAGIGVRAFGMCTSLEDEWISVNRLPWKLWEQVL